MTRIETKVLVESMVVGLNQQFTSNLHNCYCYYYLALLSSAELPSVLVIEAL